MRKLILSLPARLQIIFVPAAVVALAFAIAQLFGMFFDAHQLHANADLISSVYGVMGTIYAILLTFTLWGVWQNYTKAESAVQHEAYALLDIVHIVETAQRWDAANTRAAILSYMEEVTNNEWYKLKDMTHAVINTREQHGHAAAIKIVHQMQSIAPEGEREVAIFSQTLQMLSAWMDARRTRMLMASGNTVKALWPLLFTGAFVLFAFHGLFIAQTLGIWITLLAGTSLVIGLTFYLIFSLDCPFAGVPSIDYEPFALAITILKRKSI